MGRGLLDSRSTPGGPTVYPNGQSWWFPPPLRPREKSGALKKKEEDEAMSIEDVRHTEEEKTFERASLVDKGEILKVRVTVILRVEYSE